MKRITIAKNELVVVKELIDIYRNIISSKVDNAGGSRIGERHLILLRLKGRQPEKYRE